MDLLARHTGSWAGTNAFRLMPDDPPSHAEARAEVALVAGGRLAQVRYSWSHPDDGAQDGLLVAGPGEAPGVVSAFWGDSWHQTPEPRVLDGGLAGGVVRVGYRYSGDWRWTIVVDPSDAGTLVLTMENAVPESAATATLPAGAYPAMVATLRRA